MAERGLTRALTVSGAYGVLVALVLAMALVLAGSIVTFAEPVLPALTGRVVDEAGLLSAADRAALESELAALEAKSTDQVVVAIVKSLQGYPIEDFGLALGRKWGIGQQGKDNGVLILVAPNERKVRIDVGRRLEPLLPDGKAGTIVRTSIVPAFRRGDFAGGIRAGVRDVTAVLTGDTAELEQRSKRPPPPVDYQGLIILAIWLAIFVFVIRAQMRAANQLPAQIGPDGRLRQQQRRKNRDWDSPVIVLPGGSGGWSGGSGGSGGGFSGGGGDFGGGGASGDW
jgi:uncharacterized protein